MPVTLISDNMKTFKAASKDIVKRAQSAEVTKYFNSYRVSQKFIIENSPWWGLLGEAHQKHQTQFEERIGRLNYEELNTV